jgi:hypothetical protein
MLTVILYVAGLLGALLTVGRSAITWVAVRCRSPPSSWAAASTAILWAADE